ncbi:hypothetical protein D1BOALGB6SA_5789 [Olavius sp. associated proteobacterium Delta 1]|nr:hypothetical protein D1BOALGB6SA_5789 [Olavius sp. associated proteobacterium Delta 1]
MKSSCYSIARFLILVAIATVLGPGLVQFATASPVGTEYEAYLEIPLLLEPGYKSYLETAVLFDGNPAILPEYEGPAPGDDLDSGKDIYIDEDYSENASSGRENILIQISSGDGTSLTLNDIDGDGTAVLELVFSGTFWEDSWADADAGISKIDFETSLLFPGETEFNPVDSVQSEPLGDGSLDDPLILAFEIDAGELIGFDGPGIVNLSDLRLDMTFQPVPIPGSLLLLISGLICILSIKRKSCGANGNHE